MARHPSAPLTETLADFVASFTPDKVPAQVRSYATEMVLDGSGTLLAAANPKLSTGRLIGDFVADQGGKEQAWVVGHGFRTSVVDAALANGTMGYACDYEPHHPEGVLHPIAVMAPTSLAVSELVHASGGRFMAAIVIGCEIEYRLSMALGPVQQYDLGFHPSAVCGCFGATAAAAFLLGLDAPQVIRAFGLAGCQASGLMAWESDETENSRPFQMGMAARNGVTAALLARKGFGGPTAIFDHGHTVLGAFSRKPQPHLLTDELGTRFDGIMELAIKPYPSVSFLHPGLDALMDIVRQNKLKIGDVERIVLRFPKSGTHCIDNNPLKSHCAQYILPVALSATGLNVVDIFIDRRNADAQVRRLSERITVVADAELDRDFPARYTTIVEVTTMSGKTHRQRNEIARGYPENPLSRDDRYAKFESVGRTVASAQRLAQLRREIEGLWNAPKIDAYAQLMGAAPDA